MRTGAEAANQVFYIFPIIKEVPALEAGGVACTYAHRFESCTLRHSLSQERYSRRMAFVMPLLWLFNG